MTIYPALAFTHPVGELILVQDSTVTIDAENNPRPATLPAGVYTVYADNVDPDDGDKRLTPRLRTSALGKRYERDDFLSPFPVYDLTGLENNVILFDTFRFADPDNPRDVVRNTDILLRRFEYEGRPGNPIPVSDGSTIFPDIVTKPGRGPHVLLRTASPDSGMIGRIEFWPVVTGMAMTTVLPEPMETGYPQFAWKCPQLESGSIENPAIAEAVTEIINNWHDYDGDSFVQMFQHAMDRYQALAVGHLQNARALVSTCDRALTGSAAAADKTSIEESRAAAKAQVIERQEALGRFQHANATTGHLLSVWVEKPMALMIKVNISITPLDPPDTNPAPAGPGL